MPTPPTSTDPLPELGGTWHLDADPGEIPTEATGEEELAPIPPASPVAPVGPLVAGDRPVEPSVEVPPSPEQLIEAMVFVGGHPLTAEAACGAIRGLTREQFQAAIDSLSRRYRRQHRPYTIQLRDGGYVLAVLPSYRGLRDKLFGGPKEAHLGQSAIDVLSVVAYRQPVSKAEVDAVRGTDSGGLLRQLVRLGLVAVQHRAEAENRAVRYGTTSRFLLLFGLGSLDELPRLGDTTQV